MMTLGELLAQEAAKKESAAEERWRHVETDLAWLWADSDARLTSDDCDELARDVVQELRSRLLGTAAPASNVHHKDDHAREGSET
jgi:hypothetical protein